MTSNKRRRHTPDQIIRKLAEGNKLLAGGQELDEVCRHLEVAESTWHRSEAVNLGLPVSLGCDEDLRGILNCRGALAVRTARRNRSDLVFPRPIVPKTLGSRF